jgi:hypothetical protein
MGLIHGKNRPKIYCHCPFKKLPIAKNTWQEKNIYNFKLLHGLKYAENCRSEVLKLQT